MEIEKKEEQKEKRKRKEEGKQKEGERGGGRRTRDLRLRLDDSKLVSNSEHKAEKVVRPVQCTNDIKLHSELQLLSLPRCSLLQRLVFWKKSPPSLAPLAFLHHGPTAASSSSGWTGRSEGRRDLPG